VATKQHRHSARTMQARAVRSITTDSVSYRTRSGSNSVVDAVSSDRTAKSLLVSSSATKSVQELPSTSSGDNKTPNDVRASLEPLFEGCKRISPPLLALSKTADVLESIGDLAIPGPSEDSRSSRSRCMALRSNCNCTVSTVPTVHTETLSNGDHNQVYDDYDGENTSSGHSGSDSCVEPLLCTLPKNSFPLDPEKNLVCMLLLYIINKF